MRLDCSVKNTIDIISRQWSLLILLELYKGTNKKRYSIIKKNLKEISPKILSLRLKELEREKLIIKETDSSVIPIKCEYSLTKSGLDMIKIIKEIKSWSVKYKPHMRSCETTHCKNCNYS